MKYSPLKTFRVKNFRNIGDVTIDFTESPIVVLTGDNEAGKTSIVKAFGVWGAHMGPRDQKDYIRDNTNGFGIAGDLMDGTLVVRIKNNASNMYSVEKPGEEAWRTTTIDDNKVPVKVAEVIGLKIEPETKELLQIRTYEDKLLFVFTTASTNYKVMYNALKVEQLTKAISMGSEEVNDIKYTLNTNDIKIKALLDNVRNIRIYDIEPLSNIKDRVKELGETLKRVERAIELRNMVEGIKNTLGNYKLVDNIQEIEADKYLVLDKISNILVNNLRIVETLESSNEVNSLEKIDVATAIKVRNAWVRLTKVRGQLDKSRVFNGLDALGEINVGICVAADKGINIKRKVDKMNYRESISNLSNANEVTDLQLDVVTKAIDYMRRAEKDKSIRTEIDNLEVAILKYNTIIKDEGAIVTECTNCGEPVVVDTRVL